ncbi:hypothetical protein CL614_05070 [archaeon]|nr:hypothetical protein [archaeon]
MRKLIVVIALVGIILPLVGCGSVNEYRSDRSRLAPIRSSAVYAVREDRQQGKAKCIEKDIVKALRKGMKVEIIGAARAIGMVDNREREVYIQVRYPVGAKDQESVNLRIWGFRGKNEVRKFLELAQPNETAYIQVPNPPGARRSALLHPNRSIHFGGIVKAEGIDYGDRGLISLPAACIRFAARKAVPPGLEGVPLPPPPETGVDARTPAGRRVPEVIVVPPVVK